MQNPELGDYIGAESCVDLVMDFNWLEVAEMAYNKACVGGRRRRVVEKEEKEYPPPISPWVMQKYCTDDGRLIIEEVKVKHCEVFQAHRANGRLMLNLVTLDDDASGYEEDSDGIQEFDSEENVNKKDGDVMKETQTAEDDLTMENKINKSVVFGGGAKCSEYSNIGSYSCGFGVAASPYSPVLHS